MHGKFLGSISPCFMGILRSKKNQKTKPNPKGAYEELSHDDDAESGSGKKEMGVERSGMRKKCMIKISAAFPLVLLLNLGGTGRVIIN